MRHSNWFVIGVIALAAAGTNAGFFPTPQIAVESSYMTTGQAHPDLVFDLSQNLHLIWSGDPTMSIKRIYHRKVEPSGVWMATEPAAVDGSCTTVDCGFDYPAIAMGNSTCMVVYPGGATHPSMDSTELNVTSGIWTFRGQADTGTQGPYPEVAVAAYGNFVFAAHQYQNGFRVVRYNSGVWETGSEFTWVPGGSISYENIDVAVDAEGFIYVVFDSLDSGSGFYGVGACRSIDPYDVTAGFHSIRIVESGHPDFFYAHPSISVTGSESTSDLAVTIGWVHLNASNPQVYAMTEYNGTWYSIALFSGPGNKACSWTGGVVSSDIDLVRDSNGTIQMVWLDYRTGSNEVYGAVSYDDGANFLPDECISCGDGASGTVSDPAITRTTGSIKRTAVAYSRMVDGHDHVFLSYIASQFYDSCDTDFSNWDSASGVVIDHSFSHDPGGGSFRFQASKGRGLLANDFSPEQLTGTVDFWFFDSLSNTADFSFKISGDDGTKSGVYRMVGINNASSHSVYSIDQGLGSWSSTTVTRTADWHHMIVSVEDGTITIYLDPETNPAPIHTSSGFEFFNSIEFQGGTDTDPYYLDDVYLITETLRATPSMSTWGMILLLAAFGVLFFVQRNR